MSLRMFLGDENDMLQIFGRLLAEKFMDECVCETHVFYPQSPEKLLNFVADDSPAVSTKYGVSKNLAERGR